MGADGLNDIKFYLCPKYDGGNFDKVLFVMIFNALCSMSPMAHRETAWEALNSRTGSGPTDFDTTQIMYYSNHYTVLKVSPDGTFIESHQHYIIDGQTEHSLWLQHQLQYADHSPIDPPKRRRTGRARRRTGVTSPRRSRSRRGPADGEPGRAGRGGRGLADENNMNKFPAARGVCPRATETARAPPRERGGARNPAVLEQAPPAAEKMFMLPSIERWARPRRPGQKPGKGPGPARRHGGD